MLAARSMFLAEFACHVEYAVGLHQVSLVYLMHSLIVIWLCGLHNACILSMFELQVDSCVEAGGVLEYCASTTLIT